MPLLYSFVPHCFSHLPVLSINCITLSLQCFQMGVSAVFLCTFLLLRQPKPTFRRTPSFCLITKSAGKNSSSFSSVHSSAEKVCSIRAIQVLLTNIYRLFGNCINLSFKSHLLCLKNENIMQGLFSNRKEIHTPIYL